MGNLSRRQMLAGLGLTAGALVAGFQVSHSHLPLPKTVAPTKANSKGTPLPFKAVEPASRTSSATPTPPDAASVQATATPLVPTATALPTTYGPATVKVWHSHSEWKNGGAALGEAFSRTYSQIKVKVSVLPGGIAKLREAFAANDAADVLEAPPRPDLDSMTASGHLRDLTAVADRAAWSTVTTSEVTVDSKIWAIPLGKYLVGLAYDEATFKKAGISDLPKTWRDLSAAFDRLKKVDAIPHATAVKDGSLAYYSYIGLASTVLGTDGFAALLSGYGALNDPKLVAVLDQMVAWGGSYQKKPEASTFLEARTLFATGQAATIVASTIDLAGYAKVAAGRKLGFLAWPAPDSNAKPLANRGLSALFGVHAETAVADAALGFARWLGSPPAAQIALDDLNVLPALDGVIPSKGGATDPLIGSLLAVPSEIPVWQEHHALVGLQPLWAKSGPALITKALAPADFAKALQADFEKRRSG